MREHEELAIPEFLDRRLHPELNVMVKDSPKRKRQKKLTPEQEIEIQIRQIANRRRYTIMAHRRPILSKMIREVRAEWQAKGWA